MESQCPSADLEMGILPQIIGRGPVWSWRSLKEKKSEDHQGDELRDAEVRILQLLPEDGWKSQQLRNAGDLWKLRKARTGSP